MKRHITPSRVLGLLKFLAAGGPAFLVGVPLNYLLVEKMATPKPLAYCLVLIFQVSCNYFMCKLFVFRDTSGKGLRFCWKEYGAFVSGIIGFRIMDWLVYLLWIEVIGMYYIFAQIVNVVIFAVVKFLFAERVMGKKT